MVDNYASKPVIDYALIFLFDKFIKIIIVNAEKSILNLVKLNQIWIVITMFRLILHQTNFIWGQIGFNIFEVSLYPGITGQNFPLSWEISEIRDLIFFF